MENLQQGIPFAIWMNLFVLVSCVMFLGCLYHAIKMGVYEYDQCKTLDYPLGAKIFMASTQVLLLVFFTFLYWLVESAAYTWVPYYAYSSEFWYSIPLWNILDVHPDPKCAQHARALGDEFQRIPFSVLLMETSLTYAAMWTALILRVRPTLVPLWAAFFVVTVDALLDPVLAASFDCCGVEQTRGIGLWNWFVPTGEGRYLATWYGIPLFNYAAWFAGPVLMVSGAMMLRAAQGRWWPGGVKNRGAIANVPEKRDIRVNTMLFVAAASVLGLIFLTSHRLMEWLPFWTQWFALAFVLLVAGYFLGRRLRSMRGSFQTDSDADFNLALPPLIFVGLPALALLIHGLFLDLSGLILVGLFSVVLVAMFSWWPYEKTICFFTQRVVHLDRFIRFAYFGFTALMVLLGGFAVGIERTNGAIDRSLIDSGRVGGLLLVGLAFHIFAYVLNDVIDLPVDKKQPKRQDDPLVRGDVSLYAGIALAFVMFPAALLVAFLLLQASLVAYVVLFGAFALMTTYNLYGKRCKIPPVTDAVQALAWASLSVFAALVINPSSDNWILVWSVFCYGAGFILLINGIHGGLRDFKNDKAMGCNTTAIWLKEGEEEEENGVVVSNWKIQAFAFTIHTLMFVLPFWAATSEELNLAEWERWVAGGWLGVLFLVSSILLYMVVRTHEPKRDEWTSAHAIIILLPLLIAFPPLFVGSMLMGILLVCFCGPLLSNRRTVKGILRFTHGEKIACEAVKPPPCPKTC